MTESHAKLLDGIGVLTAVVDAGSFAAAARTLGITQSGVSRAVARLEERVGIRLFDRNARAVGLTEDGQRFYEQVAPLFEGIQEAADVASSATRKPRGRLRVNVDALTGRLLVGRYARGFLAANPELALEVCVRERLGDLVREGFDAAVRFGEPEPGALVARRLLDTAVLTYASPAYLAKNGSPRHPRDLAAHECIHYLDPLTDQPFEWELRRGAQRFPVRARGRLTVNDSATRLAACLDGHGIAQMLEIEMVQQEFGDRLVQVLPQWSDERFPLYVYYPSRHLPPAKVRAFVDFVVASAERLTNRRRTG